MKRRLISIVTVAAFAAYLLCFGCPHYDLSDDVILMDSLMGAVGGVQESFNYHVLFPLFASLHLLSRCFPAIAWFSVFQIALLALSAYVIVQSSMRLSCKTGLPQWIGWAAGTLCVWIFVVPFGNFVSYTQTAAIAAMAAVWQLAGVDWRSKGAGRLMMQSVVLMLLAFGLRWESVLPALCYWTGLLLCAVLMEKVSVKRAAALWLVCILALGTVMGVHQIAALSESDYVRFQKARIQVVDYGLLNADDAETLEAAGWTKNDASLVQNWCLLDESISSDAFETVAAQAEHETNVQEAARRIVQLFAKNRNLLWVAALLALQLGLVFLLSLVNRQPWAAAAAAGCGAGTALLLAVLSLRGRLPMRAGAAVLWPACAAAVYLLLMEGAQWRRAAGKRRIVCWLAALMCVAIAFPNVRQAFYNSYQPYPMARESQYTELAQYARENPDRLLIADGAFGRDPRLFPVRGAVLPSNLLLGWGSWNNHSQGYRMLFERFGYQHDAFKLESFLDDALKLVVPAAHEPPEWFVNALCEKAGTNVTWTAEEYGSFRILRFEKML